VDGGTERGHLLVGLMVLVAVMLIMLTVTAQSWTTMIRRDAEAELIFRGEQYAKAIEFYRKENNTYPLDLKLLAQKGPHRHRYIRKLYPDPLAKDGKWGMLYLSPTGKGFINMYASKPTGDQFMAGGIGGGQQGLGGAFGGGLGGRRGGPGGMNRNRGRLGGTNTPQQETAGYTETLPPVLAARAGGERIGLPIVGVVHKTNESGYKIYKNLVNLNDWAFTLLAEGQELNPAGGTVAPPPPQRPLQKGIGDATLPIIRGSGQRKEEQTNPIERMQRELAEQERQRQEAEEQRRREEEEAAADRDDAPDQDEDADVPPDEQEDPYADEDPNAPSDPNAPADPNGGNIS